MSIQTCEDRDILHKISLGEQFKDSIEMAFAESQKDSSVDYILQGRAKIYQFTIRQIDQCILNFLQV